MVVCFSCGALAVVLVLVCLCSFFLAASKRVRQADMREFCHRVMRAGGSSTWLLVFLQCASCCVSFSVFSFSILQHRRKAIRMEI